MTVNRRSKNNPNLEPIWEWIRTSGLDERLFGIHLVENDDGTPLIYSVIIYNNTRRKMTDIDNMFTCNTHMDVIKWFGRLFDEQIRNNLRDKNLKWMLDGEDVSLN